MDRLRNTNVDHMLTSDGIIRPGGLLQHLMYVMQVKTPTESNGPWDYYKLVKTMPGERPTDRSPTRPVRSPRNSRLKRVSGEDRA
jgi:hypothetical protein